MTRGIVSTVAVFIVTTVVVAVIVDGYQESVADREDRVAARVERRELSDRNERLQDTVNDWAVAYRVLVAWLQGQDIDVPGWIIDPSIPRRVPERDNDNDANRSGSSSSGSDDTSDQVRKPPPVRVVSPPKVQDPPKTGGGGSGGDNGNDSSPGKSGDKSHGQNKGGNKPAKPDKGKGPK